MYSFETIQTWSKSDADFVVGTRYTSPTGAWVEVGVGAYIGEKVRIGDGVRVGQRAWIGDGAYIGDRAHISQGAHIGHGACIGDWVYIGDCVCIGSRAVIGEWAYIADAARIGYRAYIGDRAHIRTGARIVKWARIDQTPLYVWPDGGDWPVCVADPDGRLVSIGCEIHSIDYWLGGADEVCARRVIPDETRKIYDATLRYVAEQMGWVN